MPPPQLLIIPGGCTSSLAYHSIRDTLRKQHPDLPEALIYDLPTASSGPPLPPPSLYDDRAFFAEKIREIAEQGVDVVLFTHSYGGMVTREALRGLSKGQRLAEGKKGGVVRVIYSSAFIVEDGQAAFEASSSSELANDFIDVFHKDYMRQLIPESAARLFSDLPLREGVRHAARMTTHSLPSFSNPQSELSAYDKAIPCTFLFCTLDRVLPPEFQRERIEILRRQSGSDKVQVIELEAGHCPNASMPDQVAKIVSDVLLAASD